MADLTTNNSTYATGTNDTATTLVNNVSPTDAKHINGPNTGIIQIQTVLGSGTTLVGSTADLASRLAESLEPDGKLSTVPITEGGTGLAAIAQGKILTSSGAALVAVDKLRREVFTASGTFTAPTNVILVYVQLWGAGGGGAGGQGGGGGSGGSPGNAGTQYGSRGRHGGYAADIIAVTPGNNYTVTVGAAGGLGTGGSGGVNPGDDGALGNAGNAGGATQFVGSSTFTATGGTGGANTQGGNETVVDVSGSVATILVKAGGRAPGAGGPPGAGGSTGPGPTGGSGADGETGLVVVWY